MTTDWFWDYLAPKWLTRAWCRRFGHPRSRRLDLVICCTDCDIEHPALTLSCCGFCYQAIEAVEYG